MVTTGQFVATVGVGVGVIAGLMYKLGFAGRKDYYDVGGIRYVRNRYFEDMDWQQVMDKYMQQMIYIMNKDLLNPSHNKELQDIGNGIIKNYGGGNRSRRGIAYGMYNYGQKNMTSKYQDDPKGFEMFATPLASLHKLKFRIDCDDHVIFFSAILSALGIPNRWIYVAQGHPYDFNHVAVAIVDEDGGLIPIETIVDYIPFGQLAEWDGRLVVDPNNPSNAYYEMNPTVEASVGLYGKRSFPLKKSEYCYLLYEVDHTSC